MDRAQILPSKKNVGVQLGLGIRNPALYINATGLQEQGNQKWIYGGSTEAQPKLVSGPRHAVLEHQDGVNQQTEDTKSSSEDHDDDLLLEDTSDSDSGSSSPYQFGLGNILSMPVGPAQHLKLFREVNLAAGPVYNTKADTPVFTRDYVPEDVLREFKSRGAELGGAGVRHSGTRAAQSHPTSSRLQPQMQVFDSTDRGSFSAGFIHTTAALRANKEAYCVLAYSGGKSGSVLHVGLLSDSKNTAPQGRIFCNGEITRLDLHSRIKSINYPVLSSTIGRASDSFAVITDTSLHIFHIKSVDERTGRMKIDAPTPLKFNSLEDFPFVDVAFNPWDMNEFSVIDTKGNWCIGTIIRKGTRGSRLRLSLNKRGSLYDPEELSIWRRLEWSATYYRLLVISRGKLIELDLENRSQLDIVCAKSWSSLRDYKRLDDELGVLASNKEIILMNLKGKNVERVISWKHDLDPDDITLRCEVFRGHQMVGSTSRELFFIFLYSKLTPQVLVHAFSRKDSVFQSIGDSSLLTFEGVAQGIDCCIIPHLPPISNSGTEDDDAICFSSLVKEVGNDTIWNYSIVTKDIAHESAKPSEDPIWSHNEGISTIESSSFIPLKPQMPTAPVGYNASKEIETFQHYGYKLSEGMNKLLSDWTEMALNEDSVGNLRSFSLFDLASGIHYMESVDEFGSLLQQFKDHYEGQEIWFTEMSSFSCALLREEVTDLGVFYNKFLQCWDFNSDNEEYLTREIIKTIVLKNTGVCSSFLLSTAIKDTYEKLSEDHRYLMDLWDEPTEDYEITESTPLPQTSGFDSYAQSSQIPPSVKSSQSKLPKSRTLRDKSSSQMTPRMPSTNPGAPLVSSQTPSVPSSSTLPDTMAPAFSLSSASQPIPTLSQSQSSQRMKKKKKRVGGFG